MNLELTKSEKRYLEMNLILRAIKLTMEMIDKTEEQNTSPNKELDTIGLIYEKLGEDRYPDKLRDIAYRVVHLLD